MWLRRPDPVQEIGVVAAARREVLLRAHAFRLRREDLEDCYSQATLELMLRARRGGTFASRRHLSNALEQRFLSRIHDRRRALSGRSPIAAALEGARPLVPGGDHTQIADPLADLEQLVLLRAELRRISEAAAALTPDQRLVLATQVGLQMPRAEFCSLFGWSVEKYRKVAQRGRARLRRVLAVPPTAVRSEQQEDPSMNPTPPQHGPVATAAGGRSQARPHGERRPRDVGRDPELSPLQDPAARVDAGDRRPPERRP
jgi:DNA-directed RNA polymerase specialized sigma24 family protein